MFREMAGISLIPASPARRLAAVLRILAAAALCVVAPAACTRESVPSDEGKFNVSVMLDTRSLNINEVGSAVIYAFAQAASGSGYLVGYVYEDNVGVSGIFPMTLTEGGAIDFYVILNPDSNCFDLVDGDGQLVNPGPEPDTSLKPEDLRAWRIEYADSAPSDTKVWMLPMSNLDGTAYGNRRFNIDSRPGWQTVPISVRRAVSKVEVWFRSNEDTRSNYWRISGMQSSDPVSSCGLFTETVSHIGQGEPPKSFVDDKQYSLYDGTNFQPEADETNYYSEKNFAKIFEYYILPNTLGGNTAGEAADNDDTSFYSRLHIDYDNVLRWTSRPYDKDIFLPAYTRNSCIRIWCSLNDNMDRSFTYTVVNWDETVTVNIPDFS